MQVFESPALGWAAGGSSMIKKVSAANMTLSIRLLALLLCLVGAGVAWAQESVSTEPVGYISLIVPAQSDAVLAVPMRRLSVFDGVVSSISGNKVTLNAAPTLPAGSVCSLILV